MTEHQRIFALIAGGFIFLLIIELLRRRKLKEEYTWLWLLTGFIIALLVLWYDFLKFITRLIGAKIETSALFIFGLLFLIIINLWFSVKVSSMQDQIKNLMQEIAILKSSKLKAQSSKIKTKKKKKFLI